MSSMSQTKFLPWLGGPFDLHDSVFAVLQYTKKEIVFDHREARSTSHFSRDLLRRPRLKDEKFRDNNIKSP